MKKNTKKNYPLRSTIDKIGKNYIIYKGKKYVRVYGITDMKNLNAYKRYLAWLDS
jgi:hypothetical protein